MSEEETSTPTSEPSSDMSSSSESSLNNSLFSIAFTPQVLLITVLGLLGLLLVCVFGVLLIDPLNWIDSRDEGTTQVAVSEENGLDSRPDGSDAIAIFDGGTALSIDLDPPSGIELGGKTIPVKAQFVTEAGSWEPDIADGRVAEWVYGTIVNPVFGLSGSEENELLLQKLVPGDPINIQYISGEDREYLVSGREFVSISNDDLFAQNRPGVTLLWLGGDSLDNRLVVYGEYTLPDSTASQIEDNRLADPGEPVAFGNLSVTVNDFQLDGSNSIAPPGFGVFLVDFVISNEGNNTIDSGLLRISLKDSQGNQYSMNSAAAVNGTYPVLAGFIEPGTQKLATAAFQIPAGLGGDSLEWKVSRVDVPGEITVGIPFGGNDAMNAAVTLTGADVSEDGTNMIISGSVTNGGSQSFQVNTTDVSLIDNGTVFLVFSTTPGFPWSVPAGQTVNFSLSFQRPAGSSATFTLLDNSFELNGIR